MQSFSETNELCFAVEFNFCRKDVNKKSISLLSTNDADFVKNKETKSIEWGPECKVRAYLDWGIALLFQVDNAYWLWTFQGRLLQKNNKDRFCQLLWRPRPATLLSEDQIKVVYSTDMPVDIVLVYMHVRFTFLFSRMRFELLQSYGIAFLPELLEKKYCCRGPHFWEQL